MIYELGPGQLRPADGPVWNLYVTVDDIGRTLGKARSGGGAVLAGVTEVDRAGRAAVIEDPTGCMTTLWEPGRVRGERRAGGGRGVYLAGAFEHGQRAFW